MTIFTAIGHSLLNSGNHIFTLQALDSSEHPWHFGMAVPKKINIQEVKDILTTLYLFIYFDFFDHIFKKRLLCNNKNVLFYYYRQSQSIVIHIISRLFNKNKINIS